jgi:hypothetical protein
MVFMDKRSNKNTDQESKTTHDHPLPGEISKADKDRAQSAHESADQDMENDVELSAHSPNDDLDEGESARLGEDIPAII